MGNSREMAGKYMRYLSFPMDVKFIKGAGNLYIRSSCGSTYSYARDLGWRGSPHKRTSASYEAAVRLDTRDRCHEVRMFIFVRRYRNACRFSGLVSASASISLEGMYTGDSRCHATCACKKWWRRSIYFLRFVGPVFFAMRIVAMLSI